MSSFEGRTLSWLVQGSGLELVLHREPCNEIGSVTLEELERFASTLEILSSEVSSLIIYSRLPAGFSAGADLRELYQGLQPMSSESRATGVRDFLERIHRVFDKIDRVPLVTVAAVHGVVFGGGFELALTCDMIVADRSARFCFPELRLGLIPGFGGIPRMKRDLSNSFIRDILLTGRSVNANKAASVGLVSQLAGEGQVLRVARGIASQAAKFDREATRTAKPFVKPFPAEELRKEIEIFCSLFSRPEVEAALKRFVESTDAQPYLP